MGRDLLLTNFQVFLSVTLWLKETNETDCIKINDLISKKITKKKQKPDFQSNSIHHIL